MLWKLSILASALNIALARPFEVSLEVPWSSPSNDIINLETVALYNATSYFPLLSAVLSQRSGSFNSSKDVFSLAAELHFIKSSIIELAKSEAAAGSVIPAIENSYDHFRTEDDGMAAQTAAESNSCPVIFWSEGVYSCDITDLYALQAPESPLEPKLYPSDRHVIGSGAQWLIVYADIDSPEFADWHTVLLEMALTEKITYVLRYKPSSTAKNETRLAGYGVGVHVKRTDYLVVDDRNLEGELNINLDAPSQVPASSVPVLGIRAAKKIREVKTSEDQFNLLKDISYNFPQHAVNLSTAMTEGDEIEAEKKQNKIGAMGINGLFINGKMSPSRDVFSYYEELRLQNELSTLLEKHLPEGVDSSKLLTSGIALDNFVDASGNSTQARQRYDLRADSSAIGWINDVETDMVFQALRDDVGMIQQMDGPFVPLKRNFHSIVVAGELKDPKVMGVMKMILQQLGKQLPLQIGIVTSEPEWHRIANLSLEARQTFIVQAVLGSPLSTAADGAIESFEQGEKPKPLTLSDPKEWMQRFDIESLSEPTIFVNGIPLTLQNWAEMSSLIFESDYNYIKGLKLEDDPGTSIRDLIFATGLSSRNKLLDPIEDVVFSPWPLTNPIQSFTNPAIADIRAKMGTDEALENNVIHSVLFSSSFQTPEAFDIALALLKRSRESNDLEVFISPLLGINEEFYSAILDTSYNMFRFSVDLFQAVKSHFYERKTAPRVLSAAKRPERAASQLHSGTDSLVVDGRFISLEGIDLDQETLQLLINRETNRVERITKRAPGISGLGIAALSSMAQGRTMISDDDLPDISLRRDGSLKITAIVDPASAEGQLIVALTSLAVDANLSVDVYLSPAPLNELPNRIYLPVFDRTAKTSFSNLDEDILYSVELVEPHSWVVTASRCYYDLDNMLLNTVKEEKLEATYSLRNFIIEGFGSGPEVPGTPLYLRSAEGVRVSDTSIMANLGYFQLAAPYPGSYQICVADPNISIKTSVGLVECIDAEVSTSFGNAVKLIFAHDKAQTSVAKKSKSSFGTRSVWDKLKNSVGKNDESNDMQPTKAEINVFTVASGHLYERFASIMMLSVMRHTKHTVKFWLIENFMSPKFKEFVPELAKEYGFEYQFVSYKWPSWLRSQSEKQRHIWGYKMLFLDVLFPQSLSDIIFVDSDQIVRTDFKELLDIDLEGAPYAFTPMGEDREEMEPYRFWKKGFWKKALLDEGFKYHISALYRVNLNKLRKIKAGDILRQQYQMLSSNPENLANLDQDLPNSLQSVVPIYSLPQEWLWCETWCSDAGLPRAKTIDLCNNPLTKEPKLDRARRQLPEWTEYDDAVASLAKSFESKQAAKRKEQKKEEVQMVSQKIQKNKSPRYEDEHPNDHVFSDETAHDEL